MGQRLPRHGAVVRGQTQKFLTPAAKSFVAGTSLPWTAAPCCGRFSPRKVHSGKQAAGVAAEGLTAPSGAVALHTVRCAGSAVSGATGAARPERSLQAWFFRHRTVAAARNRASGFGGDWRVRQQLPVGVGPTTGCRQAAGSRRVSPPPGIRTTETTKQKNASHHDGQEGQRRRRGPPVFQAGVSLPGFSGGLAGHTPAGAGE
ncbi:hypothetical protein [Escherichia coli]|uniref:hypothetical protein n=1 Tax=Escherichia coli TaxID=562 RepID=UPI003975C520